MALWLTVGLWIKCSMFEPWLGSLHCIAGQDFTFTLPHSNQGPVVRKVDNAIHRINHYPVDSVVCFVNTYPLDSDLSGG